MTKNENAYNTDVFLQEVVGKPDWKNDRMWKEHQDMQIKFLMARGLSPSTVFLDLGCGPMRLGSSLIPLLDDGFYYGQDLNVKTIALGEEVLESYNVARSKPYKLAATNDFSLSFVDRPVDIAFSNSLFSHLTLNSIAMALISVKEVLAPKGLFYSTFFSVDSIKDWRQPANRNKWGREFFTYSLQDPFHYTFKMIQDLAKEVGYRATIDSSYNHPTQTMVKFQPIRPAIPFKLLTNRH